MLWLNYSLTWRSRGPLKALLAAVPYMIRKKRKGARNHLSKHLGSSARPNKGVQATAKSFRSPSLRLRRL